MPVCLLPVPRGAGGCPSRSAAQASTASQRVYSSGVAAASPGAHALRSVELCRLASDPRGLCGGKIAECQPQLGQQQHKILVTEPAEQFINGLQLDAVREQQVPGGEKQPLQKGCGLKLLVPGAPEVSGRCPDGQVPFFRRAP